MLKVTLLNVDVCIDGHKTGCRGIVCCIALELAVNHLDAGSIEHRDARHFTERLSEYSTRQDDSYRIRLCVGAGRSDDLRLTRVKGCSCGASEYRSSIGLCNTICVLALLAVLQRFVLPCLQSETVA